MSRKIFGLLVMFVFVGACCTVAWAADVLRWQPRTPAGGAGIGDPDYFWRQVQAIEFGSGSIFSGPYSVKNETGFGGYEIMKGYYEITDDGAVYYFDLNGNRVDPDKYVISLDEERAPYGVSYIAPPTSIQTRTPESIR